MHIFGRFVFGDRGDVCIETNIRPPLIEQTDGLTDRRGNTFIQCRKELRFFRRVREIVMKHLIAMLDFAEIGHASCTSHPETLALDIFQRAFCGRVVGKSIGGGEEKAVSLGASVRHKDGLHPHAEFLFLVQFAEPRDDRHASNRDERAPKAGQSSTMNISEMTRLRTSTMESCSEHNTNIVDEQCKHDGRGCQDER